ncbi:alpha/beta hydrolase [Brevibacillus borstelensis]|uniref:alpha/beta hydrolase n=1 Tax=Brevibacillus borstelensis TaxID=45462 RepID=UPI002041696E|nr:alpha/beta hydrolase [Brevibacillus borstelensis]MCM3473638.1 alpha/beta fold hydrolase [Brevibacillus borstelensis]MED1854463.1 alpha/beta fold hydrolase [Brevibacillus borstelensis]
MSYVTRDDAKIYYEYIRSEKTSDTEVIVLIHGLGLDATTWDYVVPLFTEQYHVLRYDLRGHGRSSDGQTPLNWNLLCDDLSFLCSSTGLRKFHIVAHGIGGNVGLEFTYRSPERILSLTLLSTPCYYPEPVVDKISSYRRKLSDKNKIGKVALEMASQLCYPATEAKVKMLVEAYSNVSIPIYFELMEMFKQTLSIKQLNEIRTPILILTGELDPLYAPNIFATSMNYFSNALFFLISDSSNCVQIDQPIEFVKHVTRHIERSRTSNQIGQENTSEYGVFGEVSENFRMFVQERFEKSLAENQLEIEMLRKYRVSINGREVVGNWDRRYAKQLLLYLVLNSTVTREQVYEAFWGDSELSKAQNTLRVSLNYLKKLFETLGKGYSEKILLVERERISLLGTIQCDLVEFMEKIKIALNEQEEDKKRLLCHEILENAPLPLLAGFYDNWILKLREKMESQLVDLAKWMATYHERKEEYKKAHKYLKIALQFDEQIYDDIVLINEEMKRTRLL